MGIIFVIIGFMMVCFVAGACIGYTQAEIDRIGREENERILQ